ncbi:hypothetical protein FisN_29Hu097 [Fistulifera solaris]|uniref:MYND-type domain-containing protein n=1 Tax=Fistulifera solaris TaxID=1519565 RepID=A0A1Z5K611_FISSO|nr:hypothetical protein FisN_29Hu097 [Fistulifera solaris]|eukprot:GAX21659.1 hypothetical protein FisN_29Hu097 [Fistulifera solaris]
MVSVANFFKSLRDDSDPDGMSSAYDGKDRCFLEQPRCAACYARPVTGLWCCSRCHTIWYCSSHCQKADYQFGHKTICLKVARNRKLVEQEAVPLRDTRLRPGEEPKNLFETQVGILGQYYVADTYMLARLNLVKSYWQAADATENKHVWEKALFHALELLRLDVSGAPDLLTIIPFILLNLHRDDDAFDFMRYWISIEGETMEEIQRLTLQSQEGDWIYPREKDCRYGNMFDTFPSAPYNLDLPLAFFVALLIIKCRIVATYDAIYRSIDVAFTTESGLRIQEVQSTVAEMLIDDAVVDIDSQRQQVDELVNVIHRHNSILLPAILNPVPLSTNKEHASSEVAFVFLYSIRFFYRVPGAKQMLEKRFGKNPSYDL